MISILYGPVVGANVQFYGRGYKNRDPWLREMEHQESDLKKANPASESDFDSQLYLPWCGLGKDSRSGKDAGSCAA